VSFAALAAVKTLLLSRLPINSATLPDGTGSLGESLEVLSWQQPGLHDKPVFLLNTAGYWQLLIDLIGKDI